MRYKYLLLFLLLYFCTSCCDQPKPVEGATIEQLAPRERIHLGMSIEEVIKILGDNYDFNHPSGPIEFNNFYFFHEHSVEVELDTNFKVENITTRPFPNTKDKR